MDQVGVAVIAVVAFRQPDDQMVVVMVLPVEQGPAEDFCGRGAAEAVRNLGRSISVLK